MVELTYLQLFHNNISDISALSNLIELEYLELGTNKIEDISPLEALHCLTHINLNNNPVPEDILKLYYQPKTEDYFTTVFHGRLNADMPEYMFELLAYFDKSRNGSYSLEQLTISDFATGKIIQEISLPELALWERTFVSIYDKESMGFKLEDLNFDGYDDIRLFDTSNGNYRVEWIYLVWNPVKHIFENDRRLNEISLASFDQEKQLIYGMERSSASDHWYFTYKYIDGNIIVIEEHSDNTVWFIKGVEEQIATIIPETKEYASWCLQYELTQRLNESTMEMDITEEKFVLLIPNEWVQIAEYEADSSEGKALAEIVDWAYTG